MTDFVVVAVQEKLHMPLSKPRGGCPWLTRNALHKHCCGRRSRPHP